MKIKPNIIELLHVNIRTSSKMTFTEANNIMHMQRIMERDILTLSPRDLQHVMLALTMWREGIKGDDVNTSNVTSGVSWLTDNCSLQKGTAHFTPVRLSSASVVPRDLIPITMETTFITNKYLIYKPKYLRGKLFVIITNDWWAFASKLLVRPNFTYTGHFNIYELWHTAATLTL